jgi:fructose-bisphosphate aldolase class II
VFSLLVTLKEICKTDYAVGAFNCPNLESVMGVMQAAEEEKVPVILAHAQVHDSFIGIDTIGPILMNFAKRASVPVCVHLDHGATFEMVIRAIRLGFTSVMYDASAKSFEQNVAETKEVVKAAHAVGVSVEAELGHMFNSSVGAAEGAKASSADDYENLDDCYTNPDQAKEFVDATGVDALAVAFGTAHGFYLKEPVLDLDRVARIRDKLNIPLVMHGGSGVSEADYKVAIKNGVKKINYYTYSSIAGAAKVLEDIKGKDKVFFHDIALSGVKGIKEDVRKAMKVFSSK